MALNLRPRALLLGLLFLGCAVAVLGAPQHQPAEPVWSLEVENVDDGEGPEGGGQELTDLTDLYTTAIRRSAKVPQALSTLLLTLAGSPHADNALSVCTVARARQVAANGVKEFAGILPRVLSTEGEAHRTTCAEAANGLKEALSQTRINLERVSDDTASADIKRLNGDIDALLLTLDSLK